MNDKQKKVLAVDGVGKYFDKPDKTEKICVLDSIIFDAEDGEIISIVGPSGCGKSTLLNIIGGFEQADQGVVRYEDQSIKGPSSERAMVFQSCALFPWLTVRQNISYGLQRKKQNEQEMQKQVTQYIKLVGLNGFDGYYPEQLSGGMQQRAALARALIMRPRILLMDEPFAALDSQSRLAMHRLLLEMWQAFKPTILFVTHEVEEALFLADRIVVMSERPGRVLRRINIPFERPRPASLIGDAAFLQMKNSVQALLIR